MSIIQGHAKSSGVTDFYPVSVDQSLRFNDNDSAYLSRTPASAGNRKTWTWSGWVKRGNLGISSRILGTTYTSTSEFYLRFTTSNTLEYASYESGGGSNNFQVITTQVFRDVSAWYHIILQFDTTKATASDRVKMYVNGTQITSFGTANYPTLNYDGIWNNNTHTHHIGVGQASQYLDGYLAEVHFTDGTAYDADAFGEFKSGVWVAKTPSVTYGTNGFYLDFANSADIGNDVSGEGNDWTPNNFTASDVVLDSPTNNFCTWNPIAKSTSDPLPPFANGNLQITTASVNSAFFGTIGISSGKWWYEFTPTTFSGVPMIGIAYDFPVRARTSGILYLDDGRKGIDGTFTSYGSSWTSGQVIGVAINADDDEITFYKNGVSQGTISYTPTTDLIFPAGWVDGGSILNIEANFGQKDFYGTDGSGSLPDGYLALSTANLPEPTISPADDASPEDYFNTVLYTGNGTSQTITGVGFDPDTVWCKSRSNTENHNIFDIVRGDHLRLKPNATEAEFDTVDDFSFETDGFFVGNRSETNGSGQTYVAWNWKANGSGVSNTDGSIPSQVSANTESGFSIVSYTGTGANATVGHGLDSAPDFTLIKNRDGGDAWIAFHSSRSGERGLLTTAAFAATTTYYTSDPTDTVLNLASIGNVNGSGDEMIAYCFHSVEGFSKFGSYTGNGSADGPFVYTGFRPAFVMIKRATFSGDNWVIYDSVRDTYNVANTELYPNTSGAEASTKDIDLVSNGFKLRESGGLTNGTSIGPYIYMAFAENPFKYSNAR